MSRKELKLLGFSYEEINLIAIKLQLIGMDLNKSKSSHHILWTFFIFITWYKNDYVLLNKHYLF